MNKEILAFLTAVLDKEHARAVVEHRRAMRRPLTAHAADLLARQFARCADPNEAADEMILRGWQGFRPEWVHERDLTRERSSSPTGAATGSAMLDALYRRQH